MAKQNSTKNRKPTAYEKEGRREANKKRNMTKAYLAASEFGGSKEMKTPRGNARAALRQAQREAGIVPIMRGDVRVNQCLLYKLGERATVIHSN